MKKVIIVYKARDPEDTAQYVHAKTVLTEHGFKPSGDRMYDIENGLGGGELFYDKGSRIPSQEKLESILKHLNLKSVSINDSSVSEVNIAAVGGAR